jgi:hypothetical protein
MAGHGEAHFTKLAQPVKKIIKATTNSRIAVSWVIPVILGNRNFNWASTQETSTWSCRDNFSV